METATYIPTVRIILLSLSADIWTVANALSSSHQSYCFCVFVSSLFVPPPGTAHRQRSAVAYASQKPWLLNATVVDNITFEMPMIKPRSETRGRWSRNSSLVFRNPVCRGTLLHGPSSVPAGASCCFRLSSPHSQSLIKTEKSMHWWIELLSLSRGNNLGRASWRGGGEYISIMLTFVPSEDSFYRDFLTAGFIVLMEVVSLGLMDRCSLLPWRRYG